MPALGERLDGIGLGPGRRLVALPPRCPFLLELRRGLLLYRMLLGFLQVRPRRRPAPGLVGLRHLPLAAVTAALIAAAVPAGVTAARRSLSALRVTRTVGTLVTVVATRLTLLSALPTAIPFPGLPGTDRCEVGELPLVLRSGVIPLPLRHVVGLTCPAATRSAGE